MITGLSNESFQRMETGAGAFFDGLDYETAKDAKTLKELLKANTSKCIGATRDGGQFSATPEIRQVEADGMRYPVKGSTVIDSWEIKLSGNMAELTAANLKRALGTADVVKDAGGKVETITLRTDIKDSDYIPSIVWIGENIGGGLILIDLKNALNTTGVTFSFKDKGEGSVPFEFKAHCATLEEMDKAPFAIKLYTGEGA